MIATLSGSIIGGGATLGTSGVANTTGLAAIFLYAIPWSLTLVITGYLGNPLWEIGKKTNAQTLGDAAGQIYNDSTQFSVGVLSILITMPSVAAQLVAAGTVIGPILDIPYDLAVIIAGIVIVIYATISGIRGVIMTDWLQFTVLMIVIPGLSLYLIYTVGFGDVVSTVDPEMFDLSGGRTPTNLIGFMILITVSSAISPSYVARLFASNEKPGKRGYIAAGTTFTYMICSIMIGFIGTTILTNVTGESIIPQMLIQYLPPWIGGVGVAALLAVLMSSSDSLLNASAVVAVRDFYNLFATVESRTELILGRAITLIIGAISILFAIAIPGVVDLLVLGYNYWAPAVMILMGVMLLTKKQNVTPYTPPVAILGTAVFVTIWYALGNPTSLDVFFPAVSVNLLLIGGYHFLSKNINFIPSGIPESGT